MTPHNPTGYAVELPCGLLAAVHPGGAMTLEGRDGRIALAAEDVEALVALLAMAAPLRGQARRRRARAEYAESFQGVTK